MERWQENKVQSSIACTVIRRNKMIEWTCCQCGNKYTDQTGDTDERMCDECLNHEDKTTDYGPPYSMANPSGEPVKRRIEVEITYEGEEE